MTLLYMRATLREQVFLISDGELISPDTVRFRFFSQLIPYDEVKISSLRTEETGPLFSPQPYIGTYANYVLELVSVNKYDVILRLKSTTGRTDTSWINMLKSLSKPNLVQHRVIIAADIIISAPITSSKLKANVSKTFKYVGMNSIMDIKNNAIYVDQDGNIRYFNDTNVDVDVLYTTYDNLSNDNGQYLVTIDIDENGEISYSNEFMPFIVSVTWLNNDILISMPINEHKGSILTNTNYNNAKVLNIPINITETENGLICSDVNKSMSFTLFLTLTS